MYKKIAATIFVCLVLMGIGFASACDGVDCDNAGSLSWNVGMTSGFSSFGDSGNFQSNSIQMSDINQMGSNGLSAQNLAVIGSGCTEFNENTWASFSKTNGPNTDPYMDISKGLVNTGSGTAFSTMQYQDTNTNYNTGIDGKVSLMSGLQTDKNVNEAWVNSYFTNYDGMTGAGSIDWQKENVEAMAGLTFDRFTQQLTVTPLQFMVNTNPFVNPTWYTTTFPLSTP